MYKVYLKISDEAAPSVLEGGMVEISRSQYTRAVRTLPTQPILTARGLVFLMAPELEATRRVERSVRISAVGSVFAKMGFQTIL